MEPGWGWWVSEGSDPYLTAYVLQGMLEAHRAGFVVDQGVTEKAAGFVRGKLPPVSQVNTHWEANRLAYQLFTLAVYGDALDKRSAGELGIKGSPTWVLNEGRQVLYGNIGYRILHANIEELLKHPGTEASWC